MNETFIYLQSNPFSVKRKTVNIGLPGTILVQVNQTPISLCVYCQSIITICSSKYNKDIMRSLKPRYEN